MSSYGWNEFGRTMITGVYFLFLVPLLITLIAVGLVSGGFALWQHSLYPFLFGLVAIIPTYIVSFFAHYCYWRYIH